MPRSERADARCVLNLCSHIPFEATPTIAHPSGVSAAGLALVWKVWSLTWDVGGSFVVPWEPFWNKLALLAFPWVVWAIEAIVFAKLQTGSNIHRATFYCISDSRKLGIASGTLAAVLCIFTLIFQAWTIILVYRHYHESRRLGREETGEISAAFFVRVVAFTLIALTLCLIATSGFAFEVPDIVVSSIGVLMFLIFASQRDVLVVWRVMAPRSRYSDSEDDAANAVDRQSTHDQPRSYLSPSRHIPVVQLPTEPRAVHFSTQTSGIELSTIESRFGESVSESK
ncbi:hypothetical protein RhiJN_27015 [Ceratobasidium sp. AG-Ba]|nr:hypothetical protein RhiJN_27015 [Ceratobasidium sp. AG-Ba]